MNPSSSKAQQEQGGLGVGSRAVFAPRPGPAQETPTIVVGSGKGGVGKSVVSAHEGRDAFVKLATACERFLRRDVAYAGALQEDESIRRAVRDPRRLLETIQSTQAAQILKSTVLDRLDLPAMARSAE